MSCLKKKKALLLTQKAYKAPGALYLPAAPVLSKVLTQLVSISRRIFASSNSFTDFILRMVLRCAQSHHLDKKFIPLMEWSSCIFILRFPIA
jgi:hypothetical protein